MDRSKKPLGKPSYIQLTHLLGKPMPKGINKVILIGNIGNEPELRHLPNGNAAISLSLATSDTWKDKQGEKQEKVEWHRIVLYQKLAEIAGKYLKKGSKVYIEGKLQTRKWKDKVTGQEKTSTEILGNELQMLGSLNAEKVKDKEDEPVNHFPDDDIPF